MQSNQIHMQILNTAAVKEYTYPRYRELNLDLAEKNKSSGQVQSTERIDATKINVQRIKRIDKTVFINKELTALIGTINKKWKWTVLVESWCGDGAQNVPIIAKAASLNQNIELSFILRDENPEIMDKYLTNGSRSIPILICTDVLSGYVLGAWGPRPKQIADMAGNFKQANPSTPHDEFIKNLHLWYAKDKGESFQKDLLLKITTWKNKTIPA